MVRVSPSCWLKTSVEHEPVGPSRLGAVVVLVFLQNWRSTLILLIAVPVAIVGTFAVMAAIGFSLNKPRPPFHQSLIRVNPLIAEAVSR